jgi:hypothetical protein
LIKFGNLFIVSLLLGCASPRPAVVSAPFRSASTPLAPDYRQERYWAALPNRPDAADRVPLKSPYHDGQDSARADVFFVHPTTYLGPPSTPDAWNADPLDSTMNAAVDNSTILNQASVFNGACRVYAPRYRQAHYAVFTTDDQAAARQALDVAYADVRAAFLYFLENYNQGRPFVIAGHSQGTVHAIRLLQELVDGKPLQQRLVAAYLVGKTIPPGTFKSLRPSQRPGQSGVYATWCTFAKGFTPTSRFYTEGLNAGTVCTNPLLWNSTETYAPHSSNRGGVGLKFTFAPRMSDAQVHHGVLWISKPNVAGAWLLRTKVWHRADYNLFYGNIRENVALQVQDFFNPSAGGR